MTSYISQLRNQLEDAQNMLELSKQEYDENPNDFALKLTVATYKSHVNDLLSQVKTHQLFEEGFALLTSNNNLLKAKDCLVRSINAMPSYLGVLNNSIIKKYNKMPKDCDEAVRAFQFVLDIFPDYNLARDNLAMLFVNAGVSLWENASPIKSASLGLLDINIVGTPQHLLAIGYLYKALSFSNAHNIVKYAKDNLTAAHIQLAKWSYETGDMRNALMFLESALSYNNNGAIRKMISEVYAGIASDFLQKTCYQEASQYFQMAENIGYISTEIYNDHGIALAMAGQFEEAIFKLSRSIEIDPQNQKAIKNLRLAKKQSMTFEVEFKPTPQFDSKMSYLQDFYYAQDAA